MQHWNDGMDDYRRLVARVNASAHLGAIGQVQPYRPPTHTDSLYRRLQRLTEAEMQAVAAELEQEALR